MHSRIHDIIQTSIVFLLILGVFLVTVTDGSAAPIKTNASVETRVKNARQTCSDLGGTFTTGSWTTPGKEPGTMVTTTFTKCEGEVEGGSTLCYNTTTTIDCGPFIQVERDDRGTMDQPDDAVQDDGAPSDANLPPAVTPPTDSRG